MNEIKIFNDIKKQKDRTYVVLKIWNAEWFQKEFIDFIKTNKYYNFIFLLPQEIYPGFFSNKDIDDILVNINKKVYFFIGGYFLKKNEEYKNLYFLYWPSFYSFNKCFANIDKKKIEIDNLKKFVSLTCLKGGRSFRFYFHKILNRYLNLDEHPLIIFRMIYELKYHKFTFLKNHYNNVFYNFNYNEKDVKNIFYKNDYDQYTTNDNYENGLIDLVNETSIDAFFVTEKTIRPIFFKKPFLVLSCYKYHEKLKREHGILPYDEIFNYSFDKIIDNKQRIDVLCKEIKRINEQYTVEEIFNITKEKTQKNYEILINSYKKKYEPDFLDSIFNTISFYEKKIINIRELIV